jgi:hypothetical protein
MKREAVLLFGDFLPDWDRRTLGRCTWQEEAGYADLFCRCANRGPSCTQRSCLPVGVGLPDKRTGSKAEVVSRDCLDCSRFH